MKKEFLKKSFNIDCLTNSALKELQRAMFDLGYSWPGDRQDVRDIPAEYSFLNVSPTGCIGATEDEPRYELEPSHDLTSFAFRQSFKDEKAMERLMAEAKEAGDKVRARGKELFGGGLQDMEMIEFKPKPPKKEGVVNLAVAGIDINISGADTPRLQMLIEKVESNGYFFQNREHGEKLISGRFSTTVPTLLYFSDTAPTFFIWNGNRVGTEAYKNFEDGFKLVFNSFPPYSMPEPAKAMGVLNLKLAGIYINITEARTPALTALMGRLIENQYIFTDKERGQSLISGRKLSSYATLLYINDTVPSFQIFRNNNRPLADAISFDEGFKLVTATLPAIMPPKTWKVGERIDIKYCKWPHILISAFANPNRVRAISLETGLGLTGYVPVKNPLEITAEEMNFITGQRGVKSIL